MSVANKIYSCCQSAWNSIVNFKAADVKNKIYEIGVGILDKVMPRNPVHKHREIRILPTCFENFIGRVAFPAFCPEAKVIKEGEDFEKIQAVFKKLVAQCDRPELNFEVKLIEDKTVNAFCIAGGKVAITTGIVKKLKEAIAEEAQFSHLTFEDKLAAVLGHEIVHACAGHTARKLQFVACMALIGHVAGYALGTLLSKFSKKSETDKTSEPKATKQTLQSHALALTIFGYVWKAGDYFLGKQHSQKHELESDKHGIKYAHKAGYNVEGSVWLQKMFLELKKQKEGSTSYYEKLFSTHPPSHDRLEANRATIKEIKEKGLEVAFA